MIRMKRGTYGLKVKGATVAMTRRSAPFALPAKEEKRLVDAGVAVFVDSGKPQHKQAAPKPEETTGATGKAATDTGRAEG